MYTMFLSVPLYDLCTVYVRTIHCYMRYRQWWRRGVAVTSLGLSTKLLYVGPG